MTAQAGNGESPPASSPAASLPGNPRDGSGSSDETCQAIMAARGQYGQVLWLFGDSIFRGMALNRFPDQMSEAAAKAEPLWNFRSPASMINLLAADQGLLELDDMGVARSGRFVACYAGLSGQPDKIPKAVNRIARMYADNHIRSGDTVCLLDAGLHTADPDLYEAQWATIRAAAAHEGVTVIICSAFDNLENDARATVGEDPREYFMYETPFPGAATGVKRTHNDAIRAAATAAADLPGETRFLDIAGVMRDWRRQVAEGFGVDVYLNDNIHLNVWGQMKLAEALFNAARPDSPARVIRSAKQLARRCWRRLGYRTLSPAWSRKTAVELVKICHGRG